MNCVRKLRLTTCAALASAASTSPRLTVEVESTLPPSCRSGASAASAVNGLVTGSSTSYSTSTSAAASRAAWRVSAATAASTSPTYESSRRGDELAPVLFQRPEHALAGHVGGGQRRDHAGVRLRLRRVDAQHARARMIGEAQGAVEHPRLAEVGDERLVAEGELVRAVAQSSRSPTPSPRLRQRLAAPRARRELHRVDDLHVAGAAAEIAEQRVGDLLSRRHGILREERLRLHHDPRRAEAALRRTGDGEGVGPELPRLGREPLLRDDVLSLRAGRLLCARDDGTAVDEDGARAAGAFRRAPVLHRP